ncbi:N,N-dimethylformamidase beta subunit family domain-containing protein, partial [Rhizobium sp. BK399]|uniref:N,N-dimethylformamidase beta subunit family domain-containing protein n=1 Tax=Rhizobium sp. BK399 TaxID=2587063 RepID=UPI00160D95F6
MNRNARRWASSSTLMDSWLPRWLSGGRKSKSRNAAYGGDGSHQVALATPTAVGTASGAVADNPIKETIADGEDRRNGGAVCDAHGQVISDLTPLSLANGNGDGPQGGNGAVPRSVAGGWDHFSGSWGAQTFGIESSPHAGQSTVGKTSGQDPAIMVGGHVASGRFVMPQTATLDQGSATGSRSLQALGLSFGASATDQLHGLSRMSGFRETARLTVSTVSSGTLVGVGEPVTGGASSKSATLFAAPAADLGGTQSAAIQSLAAAAAVSNAIVTENQKQGNPESEWGIDGAGSTNIEGFATDISVNRGQTVSFKINTNSNNYRIDIYRLGYYGGMGARKITTIQHTGVQNQPTPLRDNATGLVDAGNWSVSASWAIPADATSGIYIAKLVRQDGTAGENQIPFIVRDDSSHSDVIFQTSDETWQAYNPWGGANLYQGNGPGGDSAPGRAYAVSYNRPITTRGGGLAAGPQDYIFGVEFSAIQWLEKNGYDVSYMAGMDSDRLGSLIKNHKMFLSVGHDEYWSGQQRANVEAARDAGVNLSFWSGNEVYWETRFAPSISAGAQPYRTLVSYKETRAGPIDPDNQWTGTFRDPRYVSSTAVGGGRPENALTGTMFQVDSYRSDAITIPYDDANLRFWRDTSVATLQPGQTAALQQNYLGYEWDESPDNGFRPAGLIELSSTTLPVSQYLLDYGTTTGNATATHNLTLYRAPSGALVFGAGTVYWAWGLDANHDLEATPVDPRVKQAMVNLLADMGIQPGTLEAGLVAETQSTDTTKPVSLIIAPNDGTPLKVGNAITISGTASDVGGVIASVEVSTDGGTTWHRAVGDESWTYSWVAQTAGTFTIKTRAVDDSLNLETPGSGRTVTVTGNNFFSASAIPPTVPDGDANAIEVGMKFQSSVAGTVTGVRYYKSDLNIGPHTGSLWSSTGTRLATVTFSNESGVGWQAASFSTPVSIVAGTTYVVSYHTNYGHYVATGGYFASSVTNGSLTAPANAGVYSYNSASVFPSSTFNSENYWVDVLFNPATANNTPPTAVADAGDATEKGGVANGSGGSPA